MSDLWLCSRLNRFLWIFSILFFCSTLIYPMAFLICLIWSDGTQTQLLPTVVTNFLSVFQAYVHTSLLLEMKFISRYVRDWKSRLGRETKSRQIHVKISREWRIFFLPKYTTTFVTFEQMLVSCLSLFGLQSERGLPFSLEPLSRDVGVSRIRGSRKNFKQH